jgi:hypothetical protein
MSSSKAAVRKRRQKVQARKDRFQRRERREEAVRLVREQWQQKAETL